MFTSDNTFRLDFRHPVVALFVTKQDGDATQGYVLCHVRENLHDPYVVWAFDIRRINNQGDPYTSTYWGFYTSDRDEALRSLFQRAGFGAVEALA